MNAEINPGDRSHRGITGAKRALGVTQLEERRFSGHQ